MQNVINTMTPFIDPISGLPLSGGRVSFVMLETDSVTRYIDIKDVSGTSLENPLPLDDSGRFTEQPFVADGVDFKMIVEKPTGHDDPEWSLVEVVFQKHESVHVDYSGSPVVDSLSELRSLEPENGTAIVLGYGAAGDYCPVRLFQWVQEDLEENYGTHIKSSIDGAEGTWVCSVGDVVDVRYFGINPEHVSGDDSARLAVIELDYPDSTIYFPKGKYFLSQNIALASAILENGACMRTTGERNVNFTAGHLENRGGKFYADDNASGDAYRVIPCADGIFHTSACVGTINEFITDTSIANVDAIVFDNAVTEGTHSKVFTGRFVIVKTGSIPTSLTFDESFIVDLPSRKFYVKDAKIGSLSVVEDTYVYNGVEYPCSNFFIGQTKVATFESHVGLVLENEAVENLNAALAKVERAEVTQLNIPLTGNPNVIVSDTEVDLTSIEAKEGDFVLVKNEYEGQLNVIISRGINYIPTNYHSYFKLNASSGMLLYCSTPYDADRTEPLSGWLPLGNVTVQRTEDP